MRASERGFSLIEVSVSVFLLGVVAAGVAQLFALAAMQNLSSKGQTSTAMLAAQKMEQLRGLTWGFEQLQSGLLGAPVSDLSTNLANDPPTSNGAGLSPSPAGTLTTNTPGYVDYLDENGAWVGTGAQPPNGTVFIRRWSIEPTPMSADALVLQVVVSTLQREARRQLSGGRMRDETRLVAVKNRRGV